MLPFLVFLGQGKIFFVIFSGMGLEEISVMIFLIAIFFEEIPVGYYFLLLFLSAFF